MPDALLDAPPAHGEWSIRRTLEHVIRVERSYRANSEHALVRRDEEPLSIPDEQRPTADPADTAGDALAIVRALSRRRAETDAALGRVDDAALARPSQYDPLDEDFAVDVRFRLHRFAVHLVEHAHQVDKTLRALGQPETDARAYVRRISILRARHERRSGPAALARLDHAISEVAAAARP